ncbi:hypothetical protein BDB00DRAFT_825522 [Zychaea mexicana]|uniref:uncharacterized protein n=1 Tax=Zychaea mexicana TaxID=64656 RepID=UPI0022FEEA9B|nr:uncharacterized protein BDB00DRAFT_825522 [Zychaea mexicana]KAI9492983.1 hypothetical protein BDB00DRAFT_825522 [Zychaea mexicana]
MASHQNPTTDLGFCKNARFRFSSFPPIFLLKLSSQHNKTKKTNARAASVPAMFRTRPFIEPPHLDFSTWNEHVENHSNDDDNNNTTFPTLDLDLPTSWAQTFDGLSQTGVSLIDRVIAKEQAQQQRSTVTTTTTRAVESQPTTLLLLRETPISPYNVPQQQQQQQEQDTRDDDDDDDDMESIWEQPLQPQQQQQQQQQGETNAKSLLTWDDRVETTKPFLTELPLYVSEAIFQTRETAQEGQTNIPVVKEQQLVQSLMQTLQGYPSVCFQWNDTSRAFESSIPLVRMLGVSMIAMQT